MFPSRAREISNGLAVAYLRKRITTADERAFLAALSRLSIEVEKTSSALTVIRDGTAAAIRYGLTAYDAAYVDLASRERLPLATLDTAMRKAAEQSGVKIVVVSEMPCGRVGNAAELEMRLCASPPARALLESFLIRR